MTGLGVKLSFRTFIQEKSHAAKLIEGKGLEIITQSSYPHLLTGTTLLELPPAPGLNHF